MIDPDAYFGRIGYGGPRTATAQTPGDIVAPHPAAIPFETLDPLPGRPVRLDINTLQAKTAGGRRWVSASLRGSRAGRSRYQPSYATALRRPPATTPPASPGFAVGL
jgi:hypothetical protein